MLSSVIGLKNEDTCIISVIDSKVCACYISEAEIIWTKEINLGKNKFDEKNVNFDPYKLKPFEKFAKYSHGLNISKSQVIEDLKETKERTCQLVKSSGKEQRR